MGKIRIKQLGDEQVEEKQKADSKKKSFEKKMVKGGKGHSTLRDELSGSDSKSGERVVSVGPSEEEMAAVQSPTTPKEEEKTQEKKAKKEGKSKFKNKKENARSKSYSLVAKTVDKNKKYSLSEALDILEKLKRAKFDETVELHINTIEGGISANATLPHGTGRDIKVAIADDNLLAEVSKGKITFDILLASPDMMPKLARVAKILGPKGLMPNPKNATLVKDPQKSVENFKKGQVYFKTEAKSPIMHLAVGKISFGSKKLSENIAVMIDAIKKEKIKNVTLKSTMSPAIKVQL